MASFESDPLKRLFFDIDALLNQLDTYLVQSLEVGGSVLVDIFGLVAQHLPHKVVQDVGELAWDGELLNVLAGHLSFFLLMFPNLNYQNAPANIKM